jgi:hypothetical protein
MEEKPPIPLVSRVPIPAMILGMGVSHGSPGWGLPSVAAVTSTFSPLFCAILDASAA